MRPVIRLLMVVALFLETSNVPLLAQRIQRLPGPFIRQPLSPNAMFLSAFLHGNIVHSTLGTFTPTTDAFIPSRMGSSVLTAQGFFMPTTGTFVPTRTGNFVLTTRESFNPKTKTFVPSATGNFVLSTRGDLVSSTTKMPVGSFFPVTPLTVPSAFVNPYSALANPYAAGLSNPYMAALSGAAPYSMSPYISYYISNGSPYGNSAPTSATAVASTKSAAETASDKQMQVALGAYGIPTEDGHVKWPLAFRLLPPEKKSELTDTLENQLIALAGGSSGSYNSTAVLRGAKQSVQGLSAWLDEHKINLAETTYQDGRDFLRRIDATLTTLTY